ncbi:glutamine synthetase, partial [bacterium]|nr:glutamine synthetase [bacterium]
MKKKMTADDVLKIVKEKNVRFIKIWFVDVLGTVKSFTITANELPKAFADGMGFDGS